MQMKRNVDVPSTPFDTRCPIRKRLFILKVHELADTTFYVLTTGFLALESRTNSRGTRLFSGSLPWIRWQPSIATFPCSHDLGAPYLTEM